MIKSGCGGLQVERSNEYVHLSFPRKTGRGGPNFEATMKPNDFNSHEPHWLQSQRVLRQCGGLYERNS